MLGTGDTTVKRRGVFEGVYRPRRGDQQYLHNEIREESISKSLWESQGRLPRREHLRGDLEAALGTRRTVPARAHAAGRNVRLDRRAKTKITESEFREKFRFYLYMIGNYWLLLKNTKRIIRSLLNHSEDNMIQSLKGNKTKNKENYKRSWQSSKLEWQAWSRRPARETEKEIQIQKQVERNE